MSTIEFHIPTYPTKRFRLIGEELEGMDETIFVEIESGTNISLNVIGASILELCDGTHTAEQIADIIIESTQADAAQVRKDTQHILLEFAAYGLFIE